MVVDFLLFVLIVVVFVVCRPKKTITFDFIGMQSDISHLRDEVKSLKAMMDEADNKTEAEYEKFVKGIESIMNFEVK